MKRGQGWRISGENREGFSPFWLASSIMTAAPLTCATALSEEWIPKERNSARGTRKQAADAGRTREGF